MERKKRIEEEKKKKRKKEKKKKVLEHKHIHICLPVDGSCLFIGSCLFGYLTAFLMVVVVSVSGGFVVLFVVDPT
jgi:hypothetical protein